MIVVFRFVEKPPVEVARGQEDEERVGVIEVETNRRDFRILRVNRETARETMRSLVDKSCTFLWL